MFINANAIRSLFSRAMSDMYRTEVPAYGCLVELVEQKNADFLTQHPHIKQHLSQTENLHRINEERHGAIRLGTDYELHTIARLFAVMGMQPVGYYDLSVANIPVHSTAFRPVHRRDLSVNPFRVFTSLLRLDFIKDDTLRLQATNTLSSRNIFTADCIALIEKWEANGRLSKTDAEQFVKEAVKTFKWHPDALVDSGLYNALKSVHELVADVVSFKGPHINHLTPRTLDIDVCQSAMPTYNITPKAVIEGPPPRKCDILLRQTSFKALTESVVFVGDTSPATHKARFGEIEQRGVALTPKGRELYDRLLDSVRQKILPLPDGSNAEQYMQVLTQEFTAFPDTHVELHAQGYAYYEYHLKNPNKPHSCTTAEQLIKQDLVTLSPIIYEDFLPVSAAGIFQSNLGDNAPEDLQTSPQKAKFEKALGTAVINAFTLYETLQNASIKACLTPCNF